MFGHLLRKIQIIDTTRKAWQLEKFTDRLHGC
jgi:hypothetical protein